MREAKNEWIVALRALTGQEGDTIRWNTQVGRWEFVMAGADGMPRSQFWGWFNRPIDPVSGLHPFRDLDDEAMRDALRNLESSFVGNPYNGAGSTRKEVIRRYRHNKNEAQQHYRRAGQAFADLTAEHGRRLRGAPLIHVPAYLGVGKNATRQERAS